MSEIKHIPVLLSEVIEILNPSEGGLFIDGTVGMGGHSRAILEEAISNKKEVTLLGVDQDSEALEIARGNLADYEAKGAKIILVKDNFKYLDKVCAECFKTKDLEVADGILLDIGVSSYQLDNQERGFSFKGGPLDMRMDLENTVSAATIVNTWLEHKLVNLFRDYGEERYAAKIAKAIKERRKKEPFWESEDLANLIVEAYPPSQRHGKIHPATRVFQALRIETNREMEALQQGLQAGLKCLKKDGVLAVISFHSLEDRMVKYAFREAAQSGEFSLVNKKAIVASREEILGNPRSRSAKLRAIKKIV